MSGDLTHRFPRPQRDRSHHWIPLDGAWEFGADPLDKGMRQHWFEIGEPHFEQRISVPYAWETIASGIGARWLPVGWYRRRVEVPADWRRVFCVFAGVFHDATVWVNGREAGRHTGGYTEFVLDITDALDDRAGIVVVRVAAPADKRFVPHGKQRSNPADDWDGCSFEPTSGIWKSVWLEERPATHIDNLVLRPNAALTAIEASVRVLGPGHGPVHYRVDLGDRVLTATGLADGTPITIELPEPRLWCPEDPFLYQVSARLQTPDGDDVVGGYTGLRRLTRDGGRLLLNDRPVYLRGVLDQGYWPRTGLTAPDDAALRRDLELASDAGYNLIRKHMKFEDPRQLYWADRLGLLVWVEPPAVGRFRPDAITAFSDLIEPMVEVYGNHPSVVIWGLFNEEWGLDWATPVDAEAEQTVADVVAELRSADDTRLIVDDSGWCHVDTDLLDWHIYTADLARWRGVVDGLADGTDELLGIGLAPGRLVPRPLQVRQAADRPPLINSEYGVGLTGPERGWHLRWQTQELRRRDEMCGYVYCELYDIEHETAGLVTADRLPKDLGGADPAAINADTVIIIDHLPEVPGRDLGWDPGVAPDHLELPVRISHHGRDRLTTDLLWNWVGTEVAGRCADAVTAEPYVCSDAVILRVPIPAPIRERGGRLELMLDGGTAVVRGFLDVGPRRRTGHDLLASDG